MATLQMAVQDITAGPYHPVNGPCVFTTNSNRVHVTPPGGLGNLSVWQVANPAQPDPVVTTDGSLFPVTIRLPAAYSNQWRLPLTVTFLLSGTVPPTWRGNRGVVYGNLMDSNGNLVPVLEGDPFAITTQPGGPPMLVQLSGFHFVTALRYLNPNNDNYQFAIPFRASGDWVWTIRDAMDANSVAIPAVMPTRMELSFVAWPAKNGAGNGDGVVYPPGPLVQSFTDFQGYYPVPVQRWSYPNMLELAQNLNVTRDRLKILYVRRLVNYVWGYGEAGRGRFQSRYITDGSGHSMGPFGGVFALTTWIRPPANHYVNDYDLAAVIQLGCAVALGITGNEIFESRWVVQYPSGYIKPGQLFGEGQTSQQCNNPFWNTGNPSWNANPNVANPYDVTRTGFIAHTWIEVRLDFGQGEDSYVLNATHGLPGPPGLPPVPENGNRTRPAYLVAHKDDNYAANGANFLLPVRHLGRVKGNALDWDVGQQNGDCYMSPEARRGRVGVFGTNFDFPGYQLPPIWGTGNPLIDAYFPYLGPQFDNLAAKSPPPPPGPSFAAPERYNNASLSAKTILSLVSESWPHHSAHLVHHDRRPSLDRTSVEMIFALRPQNDDDQNVVPAQFTLNLTVYSSSSVARDSTESLMELLTRTASTKSKSPTPHQLGDLPCPQPLQGGNNGIVYFVRANVAASLRSDGNFPPLEDRETSGEIMLDLADRLDKHIASALVDDEVAVRRGGVGPIVVVDKEEKESGGKPVPPLATYVTVKKGGAFTLLIEPFDDDVDGDHNCHASAQVKSIANGDGGVMGNGIATEADTKGVVVNVSDPTAVVCTEQGRHERGNVSKLVFSAYKAGAVAITLLRPQVETLMPGFRRVIIEVMEEV